MGQGSVASGTSTSSYHIPSIKVNALRIPVPTSVGDLKVFGTGTPLPILFPSASSVNFNTIREFIVVVGLIALSEDK